MPRGKKLQLDDVLFACNATRGNISRSADRLSVTRWALQMYIKRTPRAAEVFHEWKQRLVDEAEVALWECVQSHAPWAVSLVLKSRIGAGHGWTDAESVDRRHTAILLASARELENLCRGVDCGNGRYVRVHGWGRCPTRLCAALRGHENPGDHPPADHQRL